MMTDGLDFLQPMDVTRARAFEATLGVIRRRRWTRRICAALILAAVYAAGLVTPAVFDHRSEPARTEPPTVPQPVTTPLRAPDLESRALMVKGAERALLLKAAGDRYLNETGDVEAALRCYRGVLSLASSDERTHFDPADTWLLAALKRGAN
jgi:hypothetical protein